MELNINLNNQDYKKKNRRTYIVLSILAFSFSILLVAISINEPFLFERLNAVYLFFLSVFLYRIGIGKPPFDLIGKAYFKINDSGIIYKSSIFRSKIVQYYWSEIKDIKIKLFEVELKINDKWVMIDLEKFSDDNLKSVKDAFKDFQTNRMNRETTIT